MSSFIRVYIRMIENGLENIQKVRRSGVSTSNIFLRSMCGPNNVQKATAVDVFIFIRCDMRVQHPKVYILRFSDASLFDTNDARNQSLVVGCSLTVWSGPLTQIFIF